MHGFGEGPTEKGRNVPRWRPTLLEKSRDYASKIPLSHCHDEEIDALARKIENRQANVQPIFTQMPRQPSRGLRRSPRFLERKQDRERNNFDTAHPITPSLLHSPFVNALPRFRLLFGNHGVIHLTRERRSPCHSSRAEVQTALAANTEQPHHDRVSDLR